MLKLNELPYLFTLLFVVLGYTVKELSSEILENTFIEYSYDTGKSDKGTYVAYHIHNVSHKDSYKDLAFTIKRSKADTTTIFHYGIMEAMKPVFEQSETILSKANPFEMGDSYAHFKIPHLIPGSTYELRVYCSILGSHTPELLFHINNMLSTNANYDFSKPPIYLQEASIATSLAKNKVRVYGILIFLWTILIFIYGKFMSKNNNNGPDAVG